MLNVNTIRGKDEKYLILTVTAGNGHNSVAKAIKESLSQKDPEAEIKIIDFFKYFKSNFKAFIINDMYMLVCKYFLKSYNIAYKNYQNLDPNKRYSSPTQSVVRYETPKLLKEIYSFKPDAIICTHFYPAIALSNTRLMYSIPSKIYAILTDWTVHPFWESAIHVDHIFVPTQTLADNMMERGFKSEQILITGIPVSQKFSEKSDKSRVKQELGLDPDKFTLLLFSGGFGLDNASKLFKQLKKIDRDFQLIIINGNNKTSYETIDRIIKRNKPSQTIFNIGFAERVADYMSASDVMIGKAGGITINEALNKKLPLIIPCTLPIQELRNMEYLTQNDAAIYAPKPKLLVNAIKKCIDNPSFVKKLQSNIEKIRRPNALKEVIEHISKTKKVKFNKEITEKNYVIINKINKKTRQMQRSTLLEIRKIKRGVKV